MKRVYIIHPFGGDESNKAKITKICRTIAKSENNILPVSPVHAFSFLNDRFLQERELALKLCAELVKSCHEAWLCGDWEGSKGCKIELEAAKAGGVLVLDSKTSECVHNVIRGKNLLSSVLKGLIP